MSADIGGDDRELAELRQARAQASRLRFPPLLEREYRAFRATGMALHIRRTLPWLTLAYLLALAATWLSVDDATASYWRDQALLPAGLSMVVLLIAVRIPRLGPHLGVVMGLAMLCALALMTRGVFLVDQTPLARPASCTVVYLLLILFALSRLRLRQSLLATAVALGAVLVSAGAEHLQPDWLAFTFYFPMTAILCAVIGYMIERSDRARFIGTREQGIETLRFRALQDATAREAQRRQVQGEYLELIAGNPTATEVAGRSLKFIADAIGAQVGVAYLVDGNRLRRAADRALAGELSSPWELGRGETIIGQVAENARRLRLSHLPPDYHRISSGAGAASPAELLVEPVVHQGAVLAVLELGALAPFSDDNLALAERLCRAMAGALVAANARDALARAGMDEFNI